MRAIGSTIKLKDSESIHIWMEHSTKENGKKISSMEKEKKLGPMALCMKETTF